MLAGNTIAPVPQLTGFLAPAQARGNDSLTVALLHCDWNNQLRDSAYGHPGRGNWIVAQGSPGYAVGRLNHALGMGGGSIYTPYTPDLVPTGDFTIDLWAKADSTTQGYVLNNCPNGSQYAGYLIYWSGSNFLFFASTNLVTSGWDIANGQPFYPPGGLAAGTWYHLAVTRQGTTWRTFIMGTLESTWTSAGAMYKGATAPLRIGCDGNGGTLFAGSVDEVRVSNGIARWTANFAPQTYNYFSVISPTGNDEATRLLCHFDGNYNDVGKGSCAAPGAAIPSPTYFTPKGTVATAGSIGGNNGLLSWGLAMDGSANCRLEGAASATSTTNWPPGDFGCSDFTIDLWAYKTAQSQITLIGKRASDANFAPWTIYTLTAGNLGFVASFSGSAWDINQQWGVWPLNTWTHFAVIRIGTTIYGCMNGSVSWSASIGSAQNLWFNADVLSIGGSTTGSMPGYVDEVRVSALPRWTSFPFTPPAAPYS